MRKRSRKGLVKQLDSVFSEYIRLKYSNKLGRVNCYTCGKSGFWKGQGMQNGHWISRAKRILRWDERNCRVQCYACNCARYGESYLFALNLNKEYGYDIAAELLQESRKIIKHSDDDLKELIKYYKESIENRKKELYL